MNILLVRPPALYMAGSISPSINLPIGLMSIAAVLEEGGHLVTLYDAQVNLTNPVRSFDDYLLMGDQWEDIEKKIATYTPDIIGITCPFSTQLVNANHLAAIARKIHPGAIIVVGGAHPSVKPADFLAADSAVDIVCIGEGEYTLLEIARIAALGRLPVTVTGTVHNFNGIFTVNPPRPRIDNLDALPFPAYHLVTMDDYFHLFREGFTDRPTIFREGSERVVSLVTSRGCPFDCVFCSIHLHMGKRWRGHSSSYVLKLIEMLTETYDIRHVHFEDDNISFRQERFSEIVKGLTALPFRITWDTPNGVRVDTLTEELIRRCKTSGCTYLVFGVESGNQRVLDTIINKKLDLKTVLAAASWCKEASLDAMAFFVIGFPGESPVEMRDTVDYALMLYKDYDVSPHLFTATPLPGTRLEKMFLDENLLEKPLRSEELAAVTQGCLHLEGGTFSSREIKEIREHFFRCYRRIFTIKTLLFFMDHPFISLKLLRKIFLIRNKSMKQKLLLLISIKKRIFWTGAEGMPKISAVINTRNEERNIRYCLETVKWCDEIIVVDMESNDKTVEIAKEYTEKVFSYPKGLAYVETARKYAVEKASGDWILLVDADEMISPHLADVLKKLSTRQDVDIIRVPYRHYIMGAIIEEGGWGYTPMFRFFRKGTILFNDTIHAGLNPVKSAKLMHLDYLQDNCIIHFSYNDSFHFVEKMNNYTNVEAQHLYDSKTQFSIFTILNRSVRQFLWRFIKLRGYRDGFRGFFICLMMAFYQALSHIKLWELYEFEHDPVKLRYDRIRHEILGKWKVEK